MNSKLYVLQGARVVKDDEWKENSNHYILNGMSQNIMNHAIDVKRIWYYCLANCMGKWRKKKKTCIRVPRAIALDASCMRSAACSPKI